MITGPFGKVYSGPTNAYGNNDVAMYSTWYRQKPPYHQRLPYEFAHCLYSRSSYNPYGGSASSNLYSEAGMKGPAYDKAYARAYDRFRSSIGDRASLASAIAERKQSIDMIAKRSMDLLDFARALRRGQLSQAVNKLQSSLAPNSRASRDLKKHTRNGGRLRDGAKDFGNNFLELHFGWTPLVHDIGDAIKLLHEPVFTGKMGTVRGTGSAFEDYRSQPIPLSPSHGSAVHARTDSRVQIIADVVVTDLNMYNLARSGFTNPAAVAWEVVPFSFVVDWFVNVSQVLNSFDDFVGLSIENPATTHFVTQTETLYMGMWDRGKYITFPYGTAKRRAISRQTGIARPPLVSVAKWPSVTRALTSVSLLTQFLGKH